MQKGGGIYELRLRRMIVALMFMPYHDPDCDHGDEADDEGGGGDEGRPRKPRGGWGAGVIRAGGGASLGILRLGMDLFIEESLAGVAARDGDGGGRHPPRRRTRIGRSPLGAVVLGGAAVASLVVPDSRVGFPFLLRHLPNVSIGIS